MCAQQSNLSEKERVKLVLEIFLADIEDLLKKYNDKEKSYLEKYINICQTLVKLRIELFDIILRATITTSKKFLTEKKELLNIVKIVNSLSRGQIKYYSILLKMYSLKLGDYSAYDIIRENRLHISRTTVEKFLVGKVRGSTDIQKIISIKKINKKNAYGPSGFPKALADIIFDSRLAIKAISIDSLVMSHGCEDSKKMIASLEKTIEELKKLNKPSDADFEIAKQLEDEEIILLAKRVKEKILSLTKIVETQEFLKSIISVLEKDLEERKTWKEFSIDIQKAIDNRPIDKFSNYVDKNFYEIGFAFYRNHSTLTNIIKKNLLTLDDWLTMLELLEARSRSRSASILDSVWKFDGIQAYLQLKKKQDEKLENGIISSELHQLRLKVITAAILNDLRDKYNFKI